MRTLVRSVGRPSIGGEPLPSCFKAFESNKIVLRRSEVSMFAAAPGVGKSTLALALALKMKVPTLYISADTNAHTMAMRLASMISGKNQGDVEHGKKNRFKFVDKNCPEYYTTMPWMKDGKLLYNFVSHLPVEILSHAPTKLSYIGKKQWLANNKIDIKANLVPHRNLKAKFATADSILIDDREDNVNDFINAGGKAILHKNAIDTINQLKEMLGIKEKHRIYNSILNPEIWATEDAIKTEVLNKLLTIANTFYKEATRLARKHRCE